MAYSLQQSPGEYTPAFNPLTFVTRETDTAITGAANFRYLCEVLVGGSVVAKLKAPIRYGSANNEAVFNITEILASYVGTDFTPPSASAIARQPRIVEWSARFGYESGSGVVTETTGVVNFNNKFSWAACLPIYDYPTFLPADYLIASGGTAGAKFLNTLRTRKVQPSELHTLHALFGTDTANKVFEFKAYGPTGSLLDTETKTHTYASTADRLLGVDCTFEDIGFSVGWPDVSYYTVQCWPSGYTGKASETYRFDLYQECSKYDPVTLHFLNTLGGFDSFTFTKRTVERINADKKTYERDPFTYSAGAYSYNLKTGGVANYSTSLTEEWELNTDWITDNEAQLIEQLEFSPVVYMGANWSALEKIVLPGAEFERRYNRDGLVQYTVRIRRALIDRRQRL